MSRAGHTRQLSPQSNHFLIAKPLSSVTLVSKLHILTFLGGNLPYGFSISYQPQYIVALSFVKNVASPPLIIILYRISVLKEGLINLKNKQQQYEMQDQAIFSLEVNEIEKKYSTLYIIVDSFYSRNMLYGANAKLFLSCPTLSHK